MNAGINCSPKAALVAGTSLVFSQLGVHMARLIGRPHNTYNSFQVIFWCMVLPLMAFFLVSRVKVLRHSVRVQNAQAANLAVRRFLAWLIGSAILARCVGLSIGPATLQGAWYLVGAIALGILRLAALFFLIER
jgi:hypothetical protein